MIESAQIRAARALLGWRQEDLSKASGVGTATIQRIEKSHRPITGYVSTLVRIQAAFEQAGIQFIDDDETGGFSCLSSAPRLASVSPYALPASLSQRSQIGADSFATHC